MKRIFSLLMVFTVLFGFAVTANAAGFRTSIQQEITTAPKIIGGQANFKIPTDMNDVYVDEEHRIHPEFFIRLYSSTQHIGFDGGILKKNGEWYWFLYSKNYVKDIWEDGDTPLNISGGDVVSIKFTGEEVGDKYYLVLYINGDEKVRLSEEDWGWHVGNVAYEGVHNVGYELNMVPVEDIKTTYYHRLEDGQGRGYFGGAEITGALPIKYDGNTTSSGFTWYEQTDCDDAQYSQSDVDTVTSTVSNKTYLWSTVDFTLLP